MFVCSYAGYARVCSKRVKLLVATLWHGFLQERKRVGTVFALQIQNLSAESVVVWRRGWDVLCANIQGPSYCTLALSAFVFRNTRSCRVPATVSTDESKITWSICAMQFENVDADAECDVASSSSSLSWHAGPFASASVHAR